MRHDSVPISVSTPCGRALGAVAASAPGLKELRPQPGPRPGVAGRVRRLRAGHRRDWPRPRAQAEWPPVVQTYRVTFHWFSKSTPEVGRGGSLGAKSRVSARRVVSGSSTTGRLRFTLRSDVAGDAMAGTDIDVSTPPSGPGCADCEQSGGWWFHLRRCAACGHVGCCDSSPSQHATAHWHSTGHSLVQSYEPDEDWFWDFETEQASTGPRLAPPTHHPVEQGVPGPVGRVPKDWAELLH
jgi:Zn-finger in ubiquitin-hydrolases and other protein